MNNRFLAVFFTLSTIACQDNELDGPSKIGFLPFQANQFNEDVELIQVKLLLEPKAPEDLYVTYATGFTDGIKLLSPNPLVIPKNSVEVTIDFENTFSDIDYFKFT